MLADLIRHKLRYSKRIAQYNQAFAHGLKCPKTIPCTKPLINNYWLCGFTCGDGSFQIKLTKRHGGSNLRAQVSLQFSNEEGTRPLLENLKCCFGGSIGRRNPNTVYYGSGSMKNAVHVINYFDKFPPLFRHRRMYKLFRQAYAFIEAKKHLRPGGMAYLRQLQLKLSHLRSSQTRL